MPNQHALHPSVSDLWGIVKENKAPLGVITGPAYPWQCLKAVYNIERCRGTLSKPRRSNSPAISTQHSPWEWIKDRGNVWVTIYCIPGFSPLQLILVPNSLFTFAQLIVLPSMPSPYFHPIPSFAWLENSYVRNFIYCHKGCFYFIVAELNRSSRGKLIITVSVFLSYVCTENCFLSLYYHELLEYAQKLCLSYLSIYYVVLRMEAKGLAHAKQALHHWATWPSFIYSFKSSKSLEYRPTYDSSMTNILTRSYTYRELMLISARVSFLFVNGIATNSSFIY